MNPQLIGDNYPSPEATITVPQNGRGSPAAGFAGWAAANDSGVGSSARVPLARFAASAR
jgi:hypothetical protein